jgi:hypothetical protein
MAETWNQDLLNMKQECYTLNQDTHRLHLKFSMFQSDDFTREYFIFS